MATLSEALAGLGTKIFSREDPLMMRASGGILNAADKMNKRRVAGRGIHFRGTRAADRYAGSRMARSAFMESHTRVAGAARFMSRHPYATAAVAGGYALNARAAYSRQPGPNRSSRNQNNIFLRQMRRGGSSGTMGLPGQSMGGFTGNY